MTGVDASRRWSLGPYRDANLWRTLLFTTWLVAGITLAMLAHDLPHNAFFVGDPGVKVIASRNAISHPRRPLEIDLPTIDGKQVAFVDPFFRIHRDHAHAATPELFPLVSAPFFAILGLGGAFVLPAVGFLLTASAIVALRTSFQPSASRLISTAAALSSTPLLFYGLEFWEHAVAVGVAGWATALFVMRRGTGSLFACGLLFGITILLRPEGAWYVVAVLGSSYVLERRPRVRQIAVVACGITAACLPLITYNIFHLGQVTGIHVASNMPALRSHWLSARTEIGRLWFDPGWISLRLVCIGATSAAALIVVSSWNHLLPMVTVALSIVIGGAAIGRWLPVNCLWAAAPTWLIAFALPMTRSNSRQYLVFVSIGYSVAILLTTPHDGGGQWGPRFLLFASIPVGVLLAEAWEDMVFEWRWIGSIVVTVLVLFGLLVERNAYKELQSAKRVYAALVDAIAQETATGDYILTDLWWLDQVSASLYPTRTFLFTPTLEQFEAALRSFEQARVKSLLVAQSESESRWQFRNQLGTTGYFVTRSVVFAPRNLSLERIVMKQ